jgi:5-methylcytosine-specific restriction endonuclease McrA
VMKRDRFRCQLCGANPTDGVTELHVDHRIPVSKGGTDDAVNLWTLCQPCNVGKGAEELH